MRAQTVLIVFLAAVVAEFAIANQVAVATDRIVVGEPIVVFAIPPIEGAVAHLVNPHGLVVCDTPGFVIGVPAGVAVQAFLLAVDSTNEAGNYRVEIVFGGAIVAQRSVAVDAREFFYEEIALDARLTDLRASRDPEKDRQARELLALLSSFNSDRVYHTEVFAWPFGESSLGESRPTSWFGDRRTYLYSDGERAHAIHFGLDLAAPVGTPVLTSGAGRVAFAGMRIVTGNTVVVEHLPGLYSIYYHLDTLTVSVGEQIETGNVIGTVGATGLATGPHLHWEFRVRGIPVEPERMVLRSLLDIRSMFSTINKRDTPAGAATIIGRR